MNNFIENYIIERQAYRSGRATCYIVVRPLMALGPKVLKDARGNARKFETRAAAEAAGKAWVATLSVPSA